MEFIAVKHGQLWGDWQYDQKMFCLEYLPGWAIPVYYCIPIADCNLATFVFHWIRQVHQKSWANENVLLSLLTAFDDIIKLEAKLANAREEEIVPHSDRWSAYLTDIRTLIGEVTRSGWDHKLETIYTEFQKGFGTDRTKNRISR